MRNNLNRFLITGAGGRVGRCIPFGIRLSRMDLDVRQPTHIRKVFEAFRPSGVLHLAGLDIHHCERLPRDCHEINVTGVKNVGSLARGYQVPLVFLSSGAVFSGESWEKFSEDAHPNPINRYGKAKRDAERWIMDNLEDYLIIRTGWVFGTRHPVRSCIVDRFLEKRANHEPIYLNDKQLGSPTFVRDLVDTLVALIQTGQRGIIHVTNAGSASAKDMWDAIGLYQDSPDHNPRLESPRQASRSASEVLISSKIHLRHWSEALLSYLDLTRKHP